ncbi:MAG TPA: AAA family ATPase [Albitalea sp.]|nr:AAA family ATPase [Albitalea sp.]
MQLHLARSPRFVSHDGRTGELLLRDAALLAWLALEGPTPRARLAELLWPHSDADAARNALRQRLFQLRKTLGVDAVVGQATLALAEGLTHDLEDADGVLGDAQPVATGEFPIWLAQQRGRRRDRTREALAELAQMAEDACDWADASSHAQELLALEPHSEAAWRRVIRLHYLAGDRAAALLAFDRCERMLKDEVGARPSADTMALLQTIERARPAAWPHGRALPASALRPPQLIGRDAELSALQSIWRARRFFVLTGEAGSGKSRLLECLAEQQPGVVVLGARPGDDRLPLATLDRLVNRLVERWPALADVPAHARFVRQMAGPREEQPPTVQAVAPMLVELLRAALAQGLCGLVLDDMQFADAASVDAWQELLMWPALAPLHFGFASRPEGDLAAARLSALGAHGDATALVLQPLDAGAVQPLVESLALPGVDAPAVAAALVRRIGGNPLHLLETIRHALERHGQLHAERLEAPMRVTELLEQRLVALPPDALLLVRMAAVAGSDFDPELASAVSRRDVLELADAWHALERQGLLDVRGFMHDLIGEAAHRLLPRPIARVLHARVAAHLAQRGARAERLAHHWLCAGDEAAAVPHLVVAARQAWQLGRGRETHDAYLKAAQIELARGRGDAAFALLFDCAEAVTDLGPRQAFDDVVERMSSLAHTPAQRARLAFMRAVRSYFKADHADARARLDDALALAAACPDRVIEAECLYGKTVFAAHDGFLHDSIRHTAAAVALLRGAGRPSRAMMIELNGFPPLLWIGDARHALERLDTARQWALAEGSSHALAKVGLRAAESRLHLGELDAALRGADEALAALRATDMLGAELMLLGAGIASVQRRCARWTDALGCAEQTQRRLAQQPPVSEPWLAAALADIYLDLGRPDLAHGHIETFAAAAQHFARQRERALALRWAFDLAVGKGLDTSAGLSEALRSEHLLQACELMLLAGQAAHAQPTPAQSATLIARCEALGLRTHLAPLHALHAWLLASEGDMRAADASIAKAEHALAQGEIGSSTPVASQWLVHALLATGQAAAAADRARWAAQWLSGRAQQSVPPEFRDSFLHRNPVHRELMALGVGASHRPGSLTAS